MKEVLKEFGTGLLIFALAAVVLGVVTGIFHGLDILLNEYGVELAITLISLATTALIWIVGRVFRES